MLKPYLEAIYHLVFFKKGAEVFPYSPKVLGFLILLTFSFSLISFSLVHFLSVLLGLGAFLGIFYFTLSKLQRQERFIQSASAFLTVEFLFTAFLIFVFFVVSIISTYVNSGSLAGYSFHLSQLIPPPLAKGQTPTLMQSVFFSLLLLVSFWKIAVDIFIFRSATEWRILRSLALLMVISLFPLLIEKVFILPFLSPAPPAKSISVQPKPAEKNIQPTVISLAEKA